MKGNFATIVGTVFFSKDILDLAELLNSQGIEASAGEWAIRFPKLSNMLNPGDVELQYVGNLSPEEPFEFEGSGWTIETMVEIGKLVSNALKSKNIRHEIEIYNSEQEPIVEYVHL